MKKRISILIIASFALMGCGNSQEKELELKNFLPSTKNGTTYKYKITATSNKNKDISIFRKEIELNKLENKCVNYREYLIFSDLEIKEMPKEIKTNILKNRLLSEKNKICWDKKRIYNKNNKNIYIKRNEWDREINVAGKKVISRCNLVNIKKKFILNRKREVIQIKCKYELKGYIKKGELSEFIAEGLGIQKTIILMDDIKIIKELEEIKEK